MSTIEQVTTSLRSARLRGLLPQIALYSALAVLSVAGLLAIVADPKPVVQRAAAPSSDQGEQGFAEAFVRAYLTWDADTPDVRERQLAAYLPTSLDPGGGLRPAPETAQRVRWTVVTRVQRSGRRTVVSVLAETSAGDRVNLAVPVVRDRHDFLHVEDYPALVGPQPVQRGASTEDGDAVDDKGLVTVVERAVKNYLAGASQNLRADLTPDAMVTLPALRLSVSQIAAVTWSERRRSVEVQVEATDDAHSTWTLSYRLEVIKRDRWYVRSIEHDSRPREKS